MFGFLGAIFLGAVAVDGVKAGIENAECMSKPRFKTEKGYDVYSDRKGQQYINGNKVYSYPGKPFGRNNPTFVLRDDKGNIYSSQYDQLAERIRKENKVRYESAKDDAIKMGHPDYFIYDQFSIEFQKDLHIESTTGKPVVVFRALVGAKYNKNMKLIGFEKAYYYKAYYNRGIDTFYDESTITEITKEQYDIGRHFCGVSDRCYSTLVEKGLV